MHGTAITVNVLHCSVHQISLTKNLHIANVRTFLFLIFVLNVADDGSDEPDHLPQCCIITYSM